MFVALLEASVLLVSAFVVLSIKDNSVVNEYAWLSIYVAFGLGFFVSDALYNENPFQLAAALVSSLTLPCVGWYEWGIIRSVSTVSKFDHDLILGVTMFTTLLTFLHGLLFQTVVSSFGFKIYKRIGTSSMMKSVLRTVEITFSLLKLDLYFVGLLIAFSMTFRSSVKVSLLVNIIAGIFSVIWTLSSIAIVRFESTLGYYIMTGFWLFHPGYVGYKLYDLITDLEGSSFSTRINETIALACVYLVVHSLCLIWLRFSFLNFGCGLRNSVFRRPLILEGTLQPLLR